MEFSSALMGNHFRDGEAKEACAATVLGDRMTLRREPSNPYDANAIQVVNADGIFLGYIERGLAEELASHLDDGKEFTVEVVGFLATNKPYLQLTEVSDGTD